MPTETQKNKGRDVGIPSRAVPQMISARESTATFLELRTDEFPNSWQGLAGGWNRDAILE